MDGQLSMFETKKKKTTHKVVNVASVPQRSPFRYPGGKTWLIPVVRKWLKQTKSSKTIIEPFAGGAIVALTVAAERLADHVTFVELDEQVASVWQVILFCNFYSINNMVYYYFSTLF